jgi:ribosomal protein S18 acetylase RimI-like enzyme
MTTECSSFFIRPVQYRDLESIQQLVVEPSALEHRGSVINWSRQFQQIRRWYRLLQIFRLFPNPWRYWFWVYVAEVAGQVCGMVQVSPTNRTHSTWCIERVAIAPNQDVSQDAQGFPGVNEVGPQLLRHCLQTVLEARTWLTEVDVNDKTELALYRLNGFQPLAQITYWAISSEQIQELAEHEPALPNLLPVSNADAQLLYQLDTAAMPPLVRQVFDRHIQDFKCSLMSSLVQSLHQWLNQMEIISGYVFEPQRKAAIGYFQLHLCQSPDHPHKAQLTVHPAYTWLYPELMAQMARILQALPNPVLHVNSADYQPEREAYLEQIGASRIAHTLMMSRSVWHKVRETKMVPLESLQLSEVLQGFQPVRKPVPGRISLQPSRRLAQITAEYSARLEHHAHRLSARIRCR